MRIQEHLNKISWTVADKISFFIYGLVSIVQMRALPIEDWGIFGLMISLHTWIYVFIDSFALQNIIQFGMNEKNRGKVNLFALTLQILIVLILSFSLFFLKDNFAQLFNEPLLSKVSVNVSILLILAIPRTFIIKIVYRNQQFDHLFFINLVFFVVMTFFTFYFIYIDGSLNFHKMVIIYYFGTGISSLFAIILNRHDLQFSSKGNISLQYLIKFSIPWTLYSTINYFPRVFDLYIVQYFFKTEITGIYYSAKNLFRIFDESLNAAFGLVYPSAVKQIENKNTKALNDLISKSVSFLFFSYTFLVVILELGLSDFFIRNILPISYHSSIQQFNLLILGSLAMPFVMLATFITAMGKPQVILRFSLISITISVIVLIIIGKFYLINLIPLGIIVYLFCNGLQFYIYMKKNNLYENKYLFRAFKDIKEFIKSKLR